jgi:hypothetical protein
MISHLSIHQVSNKPSLISDLSVTPFPNGIFVHIATKSMNLIFLRDLAFGRNSKSILSVIDLKREIPLRVGRDSF